MSLAKEDLAKIFSFRKKFGDFSDRFGRYSSKKLLKRLLEGIEKNHLYEDNKNYGKRNSVKAHFAKLKVFY